MPSAGRQRCTVFLGAHRAAVEALARRDLRAGRGRERRWALHVIGELRAVRLFDDVIAAQPSIIALLSDTDIGVRADVAVAMAGRKDRASAPALLALVKQEDTLEPWRQSNVVQAINTLTGTYFGLVPGTPSPALRAKALTDFARWIEEHRLDTPDAHSVP